MEDIVVIIITILIAIVGALGQRKKRQAQQAAKTNQGPQGMDFWKILREETAEEPQWAEEVEQAVEKEIPLDVVPESKPSYQFRAATEGSSDIKDNVMKEPARKKKVGFVQGEKFSLKKAIIYSEILNRKYL